MIVLCVLYDTNLTRVFTQNIYVKFFCGKCLNTFVCAILEIRYGHYADRYKASTYIIAPYKMSFNEKFLARRKEFGRRWRARDRFTRQ